MEAACAVGSVTDVDSLRSFLYGRLWTTGMTSAVAAAAVCARIGESPSPLALFRTVEAELDARHPSPAARRASRHQGGQILRLAMTITHSAILDGLARATVGTRQQPHYPTAIGAVAAAAGTSPEEAAEAAAYASVAGPAFAAQALLDIDPVAVSDLGVEMAPEVSRVARQAAISSLRPLSEIPAFAAPALGYLAEEHVSGHQRAYAS
jgi:urease accessory protein